jgi:class 3 adenylate cyclase
VDSVRSTLRSGLGSSISAVTFSRSTSSRTSHANQVRKDEDLFGTAVTMASRITGQGAGGEILVSDLVRRLVAAKGFVFADRGEFFPKGCDDAVRLYEVRWRD